MHLGIISRILSALSRLMGPLVGFMWGRSRTKAEAAHDALKRSEKGREGAQKATQDLKDGETPADIVRKNDGRW